MKTPNLIDKHVGSRLRMRRIMLGMSQEKLAVGFGLTFQQVQKYEKGANRVGASRLSQIASVLGISVGELFESSGDGSPGLSSPVHLLAEPGALRVLKAYVRTTSPRVRLSIAKLVESIADHEMATKASTAKSGTVNRSFRAQG